MILYYNADQSAPRNATYLSADIQNQFIQATADEVLSEIVKEVISAKFFSLLVDETTVSHKSGYHLY